MIFDDGILQKPLGGFSNDGTFGFAAMHHLARNWTTMDKRQFWPAMAMT
jgi:hypothetical protein